MPKRGHMDADLVGSTGFEPAFDKCRIAQDFQPTPMRHGPFPASAFDDRNLLAVGRRPRERSIDRALRCLRNAFHDRQITPVDRVGGKLLGETFVRDVGLGDDQQTRRILVDPMDDSRPRHAADPRQAATAVVQQGVDQRAVGISGGRMDDQSRRLVDDQQMFVLEHDPQRNILRHIVGGPGLRDGDAEGSRRPRTLVAGSRTAAPLWIPALRFGSGFSAARATGSERHRRARDRAASRHGAGSERDADDLMAPHVLEYGIWSARLQCAAQSPLGPDNRRP